MNSSGDEEGPPPLEDMTEELERMKLARAKQQLPDAAKVSEKSKSKEKKEVKKEHKESGFGGFQKGFLFRSEPQSKPVSKSAGPKPNSAAAASQQQSSSSSTVKVAKAVPEDDVIRPKMSASEKSSLEFPEVQEAMKESFPFLNTENWLTDNLLAKIEKDPVLSKSFHDPAMSQVLTQFQSNPQQVLAAAKDNPKIQQFLQSFCALMGEHFTSLGEAEEEKRKKADQGPVSEILSQEEVQMREILAKPEVRRALEDPQIQKLIETLKSDPSAAQRLFHSSSPDLKWKIKILIDNGLLAIQQ